MDDHKRPEWKSWMMSLAFVVSRRSLDKHTQHGCVVVDSDNTILSIGYNGPPRGFKDEEIPLDRPFKYDWLEHSESNSIINAARTGISLKGSRFFITGRPCVDCLRKIINVGAVEVIYGPVGHQGIDKYDEVFADMIRHSGISMLKFTRYYDFDDVINLLEDTKAYMLERKNG